MNRMRLNSYKQALGYSGLACVQLIGSPQKVADRI